MRSKIKGHLIIIGGAEEKDGSRDQEILREVCRKASRPRQRLVIVTAATTLPGENVDEYTRIFQDLGVPRVEVVDIRRREDAFAEANVEKVLGAAVVFFTGGDQLRITSQIGDSPIYRCMRDIYQDGGTIAGTSAGAAALPETMLVSGPGDESHTIADLGMAPGLGMIADVVVDTHFAERGRIGRLLGAVAQNPRNLGLGIDEDTAIVVDRGECFRVLGSGAVYVLDGSRIAWSSLSDQNPEGILCIHNVTLHVLGAGQEFDLTTRLPVREEE